MARVTVTVSEKLMTLPGRLTRNVAGAQRIQQTYGVSVVKNTIRNVNAVASRELLGSVVSEPEVITTPQRVIRIGSPVKQAYWIEYGRRPGAVPRWAEFKVILRAWAAAKGLQISDSGLWFIARKIRTQGYEARQPFKIATRAMAGGVFSFVTEGVRSAIRG